MRLAQSLIVVALAVACILSIGGADAGDSYGTPVCVDWEHAYYECHAVGRNNAGETCYVHWTYEQDPGDGDWENDPYYTEICDQTCVGFLPSPDDAQDFAPPASRSDDDPCNGPLSDGTGQ